MGEIFNIYYSVLKFLKPFRANTLKLLMLLSIFRITQLLKFLIPIKVFFGIHESGTLTYIDAILLSVLIVALVLEMVYQYLNQSLRFQIAQEYISKSQSSAKITILNFTKSSSELTVSTLAVITSMFVISYFSIISSIAFLVIFLLGLRVLLVKYKIQMLTNKFEKISDFRSILISIYSVLSMTIITVIFFYDWWDQSNVQYFIIVFLLIRFMVNTSVSLIREYLTVSNALKHESLARINS